MKIAIISDIHENFHNLILALESMSVHHIEQIFCLGDLMNSGIAKILAAQDIPTHMIWGNNDGDKVEITLAAKRENSSLSIGTTIYDFVDFDGKNIFLSHYDDLAKPMAQSGLYDAVFFGHNHIQSLEKINDCWVVNPGELAALKTKRATYAIYDTQSNDVKIIELSDSVSLKTAKMESYFSANADKLNFRSKKAFEQNIENNIIPTSSPVYKTLNNAASVAKAVVFTGLPGVGKSLYINAFQTIAKSLNRKVTVIQWDVARKSFETPEIQAHFPMGDGTVHNGLKLCAGKWLMATVSSWLTKNKNSDSILLIEAPLVGHRFVELAHKQNIEELEAFLSSKDCQFICPIPSKEVREKIEAARAAEVSEDAKNWLGAKPSVMLMLWKMICGLANDMGRSIPMDGQPPYDPEVYEFVFNNILKHRNFIPLHITEVFDVSHADEIELHSHEGLVASKEVANSISQAIIAMYPNEKEINEVIDRWYLT